ncbi:MAG: putative Nucleolar protein 58 [Streblomastix strix]|uniref:Putative Nucleolar protein 58 n=1 Tax=Streblomastix strix TaxID=222440 RepID=A0A5J4V311_9EUKA|nr:MAG: putative Nucleolar protein 58 [Streblomastix strix]
MLVLLETPAGFGLFSVNEGVKISELTPENVARIAHFIEFSKFDSIKEALSSSTFITEGKLPLQLLNFLEGTVKAQKLSGDLAVADHKTELEKVVNAEDLRKMSIGLSHSLSRYKLKFSPEKIDVMIVQAVELLTALLEDIDKEINTYAMRTREWYGWHFPELSKIIENNQHYAQVVLRMGQRLNGLEIDFSDIIPEDEEIKMKEAIKISMGVTASEDDILNIKALCEQVVELYISRQQLSEYLHNRMVAIAPNLTLLAGDLVGAKLIASAGTLLSLAKHPSSTVQILGAEKALFRALKTQHNTPKYGLIYRASLVGKTSAKNKGKIARVLANKISLTARYDALGIVEEDKKEEIKEESDDESESEDDQRKKKKTKKINQQSSSLQHIPSTQLGQQCLDQVERRQRQIEGVFAPPAQLSGQGKDKFKVGKKNQEKPPQFTPKPQYNTKTDVYNPLKDLKQEMDQKIKIESGNNEDQSNKQQIGEEKKSKEERKKEKKEKKKQKKEEESVSLIQQTEMVKDEQKSINTSVERDQEKKKEKKKKKELKAEEEKIGKVDIKSESVERIEIVPEMKKKKRKRNEEDQNELQQEQKHSIKQDDEIEESEKKAKDDKKKEKKEKKNKLKRRREIEEDDD